MSKELRPYQIEAKEAVFKALARGRKKQLIVLPGGTGKTVICINIMKEFSGRKLLICHEESLAEQTALSFLSEMELMDEKLLYSTVKEHESLVKLIRKGKSLTGPAKLIYETIGIVKADLFDISKPFTVSSAQTLWRKLDQIPKDHFDVIVADEGDLFGSKSFKAPLDFLTPKLLVGATATPFRGDNMLMEDIFEEIVYEYPIQNAIKEKYLTELNAIVIKTSTNLDDVHTSMGDFNQKELTERVNTPQRNNLIVNKYIEYCSGQQFICFGADVQHVIDLHEAFREKGIKTAYVVSDKERMEEDTDRFQIVQDYRAGNIMGLVNYNIFCLDEETEILTKTGWVRYNEITFNHKVANWNDGMIFFDNPKGIVIRDRGKDERMVSMETRVMNIRVTENHDLVFQNNIQKHWRKTQAKNLVNKRSFRIPVSGKFAPPKFYFDKPFIYSEKQYKRAIVANSFNLRKFHGASMEDSIAISKERLADKLSMSYKNPHELTLDECRFLGFFMGDGSRYPSYEGGERLCAAQALVYPNVIAWFEGVLERTGIYYTKSTNYPTAPRCSPYHNYYFSWGTGFAQQRLASGGLFYLKPYLKNSDYIEFFSSEQFEAYLEGFWFADGNHNQLTEIPKGGGTYIGNTDYNHLSKLQEIGSCRGFRMTLKKLSSPVKEHHNQMWGLSFRKYGVFMLGKFRFQFEDDYKPEKVWCVESTSGNIVTRRKGYVTVLGNSAGFDHRDCGAVILACPTKSKRKFLQQLFRVTRLKTQAFVDRFGQIGTILDVIDGTSKHVLVNTRELDKYLPIEDRVFVSQKNKDLLEKARRDREMTVIARKEDKKIQLFQVPKAKIKKTFNNSRPASEAQLKTIERWGYDIVNANYTQAMIQKIYSDQTISDAQYWFYKKEGYNVEGQIISKAQASIMNQEIEARKSKKPTVF